MKTNDQSLAIHRPGGARDPAAPVDDELGSVVWTDARLLGYGPMDDTHQDFYRVAFDLLRADDATLLGAIAAVEAHVLDHFGQEQRWMEEGGFPPGQAQCHVEEHEAVLASVREVRCGIEAGRLSVAVARSLAEHLFLWFPGHADHMDSALAAWITRQRHGGAPVVLRRPSKK